MSSKLAKLVLAASMILALVMSASSVALAADGNSGAVYTLTNSAAGNAVLIFDRAADGTLTPAGSVATGGLGTGSGLGSQNAVVLSQDNAWLLAVNAGSNDLSVFAVSPTGLTLVDKAAAGGAQPISIASFGSWVYVLNAGGSGSITGFAIDDDGRLTPIANSTRNLSNGGVGAAPGPAQISFSPDGSVLVVTEKTTNLIDTYVVGEDGVASNITTHASSGQTPFGFDFNNRGILVVSEASSGAVSSYNVSGNEFQLVSGSVPTTQTAACWLVVTNNGKYAYTTNTGSDSITSYRIDKDGALTRLQVQAGYVGAGGHPTDMALSHNSQYLYTLNGGAHTISAFAANAAGSLQPLSGAAVPVGAVGLAAW